MATPGDARSRTLATAATALGAALLFLVEPLTTRALLPVLGGSASVWSVSLVFYQALLLLGYAYAHLLARLRHGMAVHAVVLVVAALRLRGLTVGAPGALPPALWVIGAQAALVGVPFFALAATGPLLQRWLAGSGRDPLSLYAVGNASSLVALLGYPLVVERLLPLSGQATLWSAGFIVFAVCTLAAMARLRHCERPAPTAPASARQRLRWVALAAIPSAVMLGTTQALTTDVAAVPLLWVLPLAAYLLTFVVAFARPPSRRGGWIAVPALVLAVAACQWWAAQPDPRVAIPLTLGALLAVGLLCHGRLVRLRPPAGDLTAFYLCIAAGGALGSLLCALVAPLLFRSVAEYPLALVLACLAIPSRRLAWPAALGVATAFAAVALHDPTAGHDRLTVRSFFGVLRVKDAPGPSFRPATGPHAGQAMSLPMHELFHGTTLHGLQVQRPSEARLPTSYYHPSGPIGHVFAALAGTPEIAVVGLGVGTLAAYAAPGARLTFFEIDPAVVRIARDPALFSYLRDARGRVEVVVADGRLALGQQADRRFGLIVIDAFGSDAVPVHLLTREALALYLARLAPGGLVAFHLSSRFFDLAAVVAEAAAGLGKPGLYWHDTSLSPVDVITGKRPSDWAVIASDARDLQVLAGGWGALSAQRRAGAGWTDQYSSPLGALRPWTGRVRALAPVGP
jgi:hypothetical protein